MNLNWNPPQINPELAVQFTWGDAPDVEDYAAEVYFGLGGAGFDMPGRPWAEYVYEGQGESIEDMLQESVVPDNIEQTFVNFSYTLGFAFQDAMEAPIWEWPNETIRSDGQVVGSPRDIVDTGRLRDSQTIEFFGLSQ